MAKEPQKGTAIVKSIRDQVEAARGQIASVLPTHMSVDRVVTGVRLALAMNPALEQCEPKTVLFSVMAACRLGLEINSPLQQCWLIPYGKECTLQVGYRGYQELARRDGSIRNIEARCVYDGDVFDYQLGTTPLIAHKPMGVTDDDKITHVYAIAFDPQGKAFAFDVLRRDEVEAARAVSRMKDGPAWSKWYGEMARKTAVRRLAKYLPLSPELAAAIELDLRGDTGQATAAIPLIDSPGGLNDSVATKTAQQLEDLKGRMDEPTQPTVPQEPVVVAAGETAAQPEGKPPW